MRSNTKKEVQKAPQCTICMQKPINSSVDGCSHEFCLRCIKKWSRTKNTCPLCRQRFFKIQTKNKTIQVENVPQRVRPPRQAMQASYQLQRGMFYVPLMVYPQPNCIFYPPASGILMGNNMPNMMSTTYPFGMPSFFIPNV